MSFGLERKPIMRVAIFIMLLIFTSSVCSAKALDENVVLLFNFDKDSLVYQGNELTKVIDLSGNKNDAYVNTQGGEPAKILNVKPSGPPAVVPGKFGNALYFDGTNFLEVLTSKTLEITDQITLEAWINPDVLSLGADNMTILTKDCAYYMVLRENGSLSNYLYGVNPPGYHLSKTKLKAKEWSHVAITYDGKDIKLYINGELESTIGAGGNILVSGCGAPQSIGIGCEVRIPSRNEANHRYYQGYIDEIRISNKARSIEEIRESFQNGLDLAVSHVGKIASLWGEIKSIRN